jgi:SAM-dependent methyltransferase
MNKTQCCTVSCEKTLDQDFWDAQYKANNTGWDLGCVSPIIQSYIDALTNKELAILIPGCGNTYEAEYMLQKGFSNVTVIDIAPTLVEILRQRFKDNPNIKIILGDFFEHQGTYDLILEQTFFCALPPFLRQKYVWKMHQLLTQNGILVGLLFDKTFESGPPFGGNKEEYELLFRNAFDFITFEIACNSVKPRANCELDFHFEKNDNVQVRLYSIDGISTIDSKEAVIKNLSEINSVQNVSISTNLTSVLIVSSNEISITEIQAAIAENGNFKIKKHEK